AFGIGSAFLLAGVQNYIGTFCVIHDAHSAAFAADFYRHLLRGECLGAALTAARRTARQEIDQGGLLWASYMHYGNPTFRLPLRTAHEAVIPDCRPYAVSTPALEVMSDGAAEPRVGLQESRDVADRGEARGSTASGRAAATPEDSPTPEASAAPPDDVQTASRRFGGRRNIWIIAAGVCLIVV